MGVHDDYGKLILRSLNCGIQTDGPGLAIDFGAGQPGRVDGVVPGHVVVEIESRTTKQVRGAVLDLIYHPAPRKLLILVPRHMQNPRSCRDQCAIILARFVQPDQFRVVLLSGTGDMPQLYTDTAVVGQALDELSPSATM